MRLTLAEKRQRVPIKDRFQDRLRAARNLRALTSGTSSYLVSHVQKHLLAIVT
jgi:hypothetical protein